MNELVLPLMGEGVNEAIVVKWLVKEGDTVQKDAPIVEVSTDKVDTEVTSPFSGKLVKILVAEGETAHVNQAMAHIDDGSSNNLPENEATVEKLVVRPQSSSERAESKLGSKKSSPLVRKMAKDLEIDLEQVEGSGLNGRITKKDLLGFQPNKPKTFATPSPLTAPQQLDWMSQLTTYRGEDGREYLDGVAVERKPMDRMRQLIAKHMVESVRKSPHVTTVFEIDMHQVVQAREARKLAFEKQEGFKLTYTPMLIYAAVQAIKEHPLVNTSIDGSDILFKQDINVGCAVAIDGGLIVPVIKKAGELNLLGIARRLNDLVTRARAKKLKSEDIQGGSFSITNPGGFGSLTSNPIINQPEVAILGIGSIVKRPVVIDDMIAVRPQMLASLTFDHRVLDGEGGAKYLASFKRILESFTSDLI